MFRELTRKNKALSREDCVALLETERRGVLSVQGDGGYPYGMPMNHLYNADDGCIYFHCGRAGHRLDALRACDKVSFCVCEAGKAEDGDWALTVRSVIVFGRMEILDDRDAVVALTARLCRKFTSDEAYIEREIRAYAAETLLLRLVPEQICGKWVKEA